MTLRNTSESYGSASKFFHWLIAVLVVIMLCAGVSFNYLPEGALFNTVMFIHKSTGVTILILMALRLIWRWVNPYPNLPTHMKPWEINLARSTHFLFYLLLIAMPLTGIIMTLSAGYSVPFWGLGHIHFAFIIKNKATADLMDHWHEYLAWAIAGLIVIHTLAALKHHYIDKDNTMKRMWRD